MTSEFYEQLGVDRSASSARIRSAYGAALGRLAKRRRALVEQDGDTTQLDLQQVRVEEAWTVLSDPMRRRRYDAMLAYTEERCEPTADGVWEAVSDALVHPAAAVAGKLLRVTSRLAEIGQLPLAPSAGDEPPTLVPHDDDLTTPRVARLGPKTDADDQGYSGALSDPGELRSVPPPVLRAADLRPMMSLPPLEVLPTIPSVPGVDVSGAPPPAALRVVDGSPGASDVFVMPRKELPPPPTVPSLPPEALSALVDQLGYSGALLRAVRERAKLSLTDIADHTRISIRYLEALEDEERETLPAPTFIRGYVREVGRLLSIDPEALVAGYMRRFDD